MKDEKSNKTTHIAFDKVLQARLAELSADSGMTITNVIRQAVNEKYDRYERAKYGYKGSVTKNRLDKDAKVEQQQAAIVAIKNMTAEELTQYLRDINYLPADAPVEINDNLEYHYRVSLRDGQLKYVLWYYDKTTKVETNPQDVFDLEDLISDLKKQKKL